jgi:hypothetical protein
MNPQEVIEHLMNYWGMETQKELALHLGVGERSISQYQSRKTADIQTAIITAQKADIDYLDTQLKQARQTIKALSNQFDNHSSHFD